MPTSVVRLFLPWFIFPLPMLTFPFSEWVVGMHPGFISCHHSVQVSRIFCNETRKCWSILYTDLHLITSEHVWYPRRGHTHHLQYLCENTMDYHLRDVPIGEPSRTLADKCQFSSITAQIVLMFVSMIGIRGWPPFSSCSSASFRFFENVKCHWCIVNSAIHSDSQASQQFNRFHHQFVKTNAKFDANTFILLRIHNSHKN